MSGKNDIGNVVAGIATCAVMIYVAIQIVNDLLENEPFYRYLLLIALSFIASVCLVNDAKTAIAGGAVATAATIFAYWLFDKDSLPILVIILVILIVGGLYLKIKGRE